MLSSNLRIRYEEDLVKNVCNVLASHSSPWNRVNFAVEFNFCRGRTDIIAVNPMNVIIAFEAKLNRWRDALRQAYRNTCFANYSFVVLPDYVAGRVASEISDFEAHSVGLVSSSPGQLKILIHSPFHEPIQPWLSQDAIEMATFNEGVSI